MPLSRYHIYISIVEVTNNFLFNYLVMFPMKLASLKALNLIIQQTADEW
jgi:hypothetical protein